MEKMNDGILSNKLEALYELAQSMEDELRLIDGDTVFNRRMKAIKDYPLLISNYQACYKEIAEQLDLYAEDVNLIEFIIEWAIYDPSIIRGLAEKLHLIHTWSYIPGRTPKMI